MANESAPEENPAAEQLAEQLDELELGEPFAIAHDCQLLAARAADANHPAIPGCYASVQCHGCGTVFKIDLLSREPDFGCPGCELIYTSCLLVCLADDPEIVANFMGVVLHFNGIEPPQLPPGGDDDPDAGDERDPNDDEEQG